MFKHILVLQIGDFSDHLQDHTFSHAFVMCNSLSTLSHAWFVPQEAGVAFRVYCQKKKKNWGVWGVLHTVTQSYTVMSTISSDIPSLACTLLQLLLCIPWFNYVFLYPQKCICGCSDVFFQNCLD